MLVIDNNNVNRVKYDYVADSRFMRLQRHQKK